MVLACVLDEDAAVCRPVAVEGDLVAQAVERQIRILEHPRQQVLPWGLEGRPGAEVASRPIKVAPPDK